MQPPDLGAVIEIVASKWTITTYYLFIAKQEGQMFLHNFLGMAATGIYHDP